MKTFLLVTSPPASGKTFIAKQLASMLQNCVYLDKDSVIVLSRRIFQAAGEPFDRSSAFFEQNIRNYEYDAILQIAFEALEFNHCVLVNAPFTREVRNPVWLEEDASKAGGDGRPASGGLGAYGSGGLPKTDADARLRAGYLETGTLGGLCRQPEF